MADVKGQILDRLCKLEVAVRKNSEAAKEELNKTISWLAQYDDEDTSHLILDYLTKARRHMETGQKMSATRRVRAAIVEVRTW